MIGGPNLDAIPQELRQTDAWIGWRFELRKLGLGKEAWAKVPIDLRTGFHAKTDDRSTWCDWATAVAEFRAGRYSGLGLCRTKDWAFIDLDGCLDSDGRL